MLKDAIECIVKLGQIKTLEVNKHTYSPDHLNLIKEPSPAALELTTLTGLVGYVKSAVDGEFHGSELLVQVVSPSEVRIYSPLCSDASRHAYVTCHPILPKIILNNFIDVEEMNIMLQSCFVPSIGSVSDVLKVVGNIKEENVQTIGDDGISQSVVAKSGIAIVDNVKVPNPVTLAPYRSFPEIEQVETDFVLRMKSGGNIALFEADGGAWRVEAARRITEFLELEFSDLEGVKVIA